MRSSYLEYNWNGSSCREALEAERICFIGRGQTNTIALPDDDAIISSRHASIHALGGHFYLSDLNSRNGTMLNGRPVTLATLLRDGDVITVGKCELVFRETEIADDSQSESSNEGRPESIEFPRTQLFVLRQLVTVLVADIRDYTGLTLTVGDTRMSQILGTLFQKAGEILNKNGAWGQKYIGDAVMGIWLHQNDTPTPDELKRIFNSLIRIGEVFEALNGEKILPVPIRFGAAVNTGYALVGNLGSKTLPDHTAIGDSVNMAFRLESATRDLEVDVVLGKLTYKFMCDLLDNNLNTCADVALHSVALKGYPELEQAYATSLPALSQIVQSWA
jgi:adenylate cyclase